MNEEKERFPIEITNEDLIAEIKKANALEWIANHQFQKYRDKIAEVFEIIYELHGLDKERHVYSISGERPTIYYVRPILKEKTDDDE